MARDDCGSVDEYIASQREEARAISRVRAIIRKAVPGAEEAPLLAIPCHGARRLGDTRRVGAVRFKNHS